MVRPCLCAHPQIEEQKKIMSSATKTFTTDKGYLSQVAEKQQKFRSTTAPGFRPSLTAKLSFVADVGNRQHTYAIPAPTCATTAPTSASLAP